MSATANPLKLRSQPAAEKAKAMPVPLSVESPAEDGPGTNGPCPPPIPSTPPAPQPPAAVAPATPARQPRFQAPVPQASRPPARDLGIFGRIVVWGLLFTLVGGSSAGWFLAANALGSMAAGFTGAPGEVPGFDMGAMPQDIMQHFASTMESAMGTAAFSQDTSEPDEAGAVTLTPVNTEATPPRENPQLKEVNMPNLEWPDMQLNGVLVGSENWKGSVILDSEMVPLNSAFNGMKLVAVETYGAWFEYKGARKYVSVHDRTR